MEGPSPSAVFIGTSLDTHLAMLVSDTDTVSDLKEKIEIEHKACFPTLGEIHVNAVKVKRRGDFYHLADSMHVRSAFNGVRKNWFLSVDASILSDYSDGQNMLNPSSSSQPVLLAITSKPSSDQLDTAPDDQPETVPKGLSTFEVSAKPKAGSYQNGDKVVPVLASDNLGVKQIDGVDCSEVNRMSPLPSLGMTQNNEISTSNALPTKPLGIGDSFTNGSRNKKRKKNEKRSKVCNPENLSHPSSREAISNEMEMQKESLVSDHKDITGEPEIIVASDQSIRSPKSSEPQQAFFTEKLAEPIQEKGIEMYDMNSGKQYGGDSAGDGLHSFPLVVNEPDHSKREFGQTKVTGDIEKAIVTCESAAASTMLELKASAKKRKRSKKLELDGECIKPLTEHIESSLVGRSLADLQKDSEGDESQNKLENRENFLFQARGGETMVMAAAEPLDMHATKMESSQQVIEKNMEVESTKEKTKKKSKKSRRSTVENLPSLEMKVPNSDINDPLVTSAVNETTNKHTSHRRPVKASSHASEEISRGDPPHLAMNVDLLSNDHLDKGENLSETGRGETIAKVAAPGHLDVHRNKAESSQQIIEKEVKVDSIGEKTKKKKKKSRTSTGVNLLLAEMKDPSSDAFELTPMSTTLNDTTNEHTSKPIKVPSHSSDENNESGPPQSIINVDLPSVDQLDKGNSNFSQARGGETIVRAANVEPLDVHGTNVESSQQIVEKELNFDCTEEKRKKKKKKSQRSTGENVLCVEMKDPKSDAFQPTMMRTTTLNETMNEHTRYREPMKAPPHTSESNNEGGPPQSIFEVEFPSGDQLDEGENDLSQAREGEKIVRAATVEPLDVHGTKAESSQQIIERVNFENAEEKKTKKKQKKSGRSTMENLPSVEMKDPKPNHNDPVTLSGTTVDGTANGHTNYVKPMEAPSHTSEGNNKRDPAQSIANVDLPSGDHLAKGENNLYQTRAGETMVRAAVVEPIVVHRIRAESLEQIIDKEIIESTGQNADKKTRKSRRSTVENLSGIDMENPDSDANDPIPVNATVNETDQGQTSSMKTMKALSYTYEGNNEDYPLQSIRDVDLLSSGNHLDEVNNHVNPVNGSDVINFSDYFVPTQLQQEALAPDNSFVDGGTTETTENRAAKKVKSKRRKKADATVDGSSSALQSSLISNEPQDGLKPPPGNSYTIQLQESLANDKNGRSGSYEKEPPLGPGSTDLTSSSKLYKFKIIAEEAPGAKVIVVTPNLEKDGETSAASGSDMKRMKKVKAGNERRLGVDRYRLAVRKPFPQHIEEVVDTSERKKSLLATSVAIFKDESSGSSAEAEGIEDSDASTRTPSDTLLSDYSDVDNNPILNSPRDGNLSSKHRDGSSMKKSQFSDRKDLTLDKILRSSSRYKKAKLAASQSQLEDSESQPLDFVPDSQANS